MWNSIQLTVDKNQQKLLWFGTTGQDKESFVTCSACTSSQLLRVWSAAGQGKPSTNSEQFWAIFDIFTHTHVKTINITASKPWCSWGRSINSLLLRSVTKHAAGSEWWWWCFPHLSSSAWKSVSFGTANRQQSAKCLPDRDVRRKDRGVPWQERGQTLRFLLVKWVHWVKNLEEDLAAPIKNK